MSAAARRTSRALLLVLACWAAPASPARARALDLLGVAPQVPATATVDAHAVRDAVVFCGRSRLPPEVRIFAYCRYRTGAGLPLLGPIETELQLEVKPAADGAWRLEVPRTRGKLLQDVPLYYVKLLFDAPGQAFDSVDATTDPHHAWLNREHADLAELAAVQVTTGLTRPLSTARHVRADPVLAGGERVPGRALFLISREPAPVYRFDLVPGGGAPGGHAR